MTEDEILNLIGKPEGEHLEYKAVLPTSRSIGQLISAFANSNGGYIILGVSEKPGNIEVTGLSEDFFVQSIVHKAIDLLSPRPKNVEHEYFNIQSKKIYAIKVAKSKKLISIEGNTFIRVGDRTQLNKTPPKPPSRKEYLRVTKLRDKFDEYSEQYTEAMSKFIEHFRGVLNIITDLSQKLYPETPSTPTSLLEGKILIRILFSSCADNLETYLSDLLYEIYLAKPETLKSAEKISVSEVLSCSDIPEFITFFAKKKLGKLQRGSVKGFISENEQIRSLQVIDQNQAHELEKILQIRHLYAHKNGIVDEKFLQFFKKGYKLNDSHEMSIDTMLEQLEYLVYTVARIDKKALSKFHLAAAP